MEVIHLTPQGLAMAAVLVVLLALLSLRLRLGMAGQLVVAAIRTTIQLLLVGLVLEAIFSNVHLGWVALIAIIMLLAAGREVMARQHRRLKGPWGFGVGTLSMFVSTFAITLLALTVIIGVDPWYEPQYSIPLLGMMLGNTMNGIALSMDRLLQGVWQQRAVIEARLMLGQSGVQALTELRQEAMRTGMIPIINAMAAAGLVSLPGMMTGQILSGTPPMQAVQYQILIMFMITAGTGFGTLAAVWMTTKRLLDDRDRLRLERLYKGR
ncbi:MAG: iron export ABC transporter permease subunit FetB [Gammaproteobacteria bacterium]|nr:MAG: iron export ABC transporter permease subunit FetB [Gammaproteobacteria bacterium]